MLNRGAFLTFFGHFLCFRPLPHLQTIAALCALSPFKWDEWKGVQMEEDVLSMGFYCWILLEALAAYCSGERRR